MQDCVFILRQPLVLVELIGLFGTLVNKRDNETCYVVSSLEKEMSVYAARKIIGEGLSLTLDRNMLLLFTHWGQATNHYLSEPVLTDASVGVT